MIDAKKGSNSLNQWVTKSQRNGFHKENVLLFVHRFSIEKLHLFKVALMGFYIVKKTLQMLTKPNNW